MIEYRKLTADNVRTLRERKLGDVEAEHAALKIDLQLADVAGINNDAVTEGRAQLDMLEAQHTALTAWLDREPDPCPDS